MTRKDYIAIAQAVKETWEIPFGAREELVQRLITIMAKDNERFDRDRFKDACGL